MESLMRWVDDTDGSFLCVAFRDEAFLDPLESWPSSLLFSRFALFWKVWTWRRAWVG